MIDPVMDPDGNTYERAAIIQWLSTHNTSPITRAPLTVNQLIPNRSLRSAIEDELAKQSINVKQNQDNNTNIVDPGNVIPIEELSGIEPVSISLTQGDAKYNTAENCTEVDVLVTLSAPSGRGRGSIDVCCVVDISGSMGTQATVPGVEQTGLSLLDIVKHALKTVINSLGPSDRLSVIEFSDQARVVFPLSPMNAAGKARVQQCVDGLRPGGRTNLWDGLVKGMDMLTSGITGGNRNISMFLLTDGEPNIEPPRGHMPMMLRYKNSHGGQYPGVIHTFGFGYTLDSQLLLNIARESGGEYAFIPDSGFVGTVFVNALSNQLVAFANHSTLSLELRENARLKSICEGTNWTATPAGVLIDVGDMHFGQNRDFVIKLSFPGDVTDMVGGDIDYISALLKYSVLNDGSNLSSTQNRIVKASTERKLQMELDLHLFRTQMINFILKCSKGGSSQLNNLSDEGDIIAMEMQVWVDRHRGATGEEGKIVDHVKGILEDLTGQVREALSRSEYYTKWGTHYLPSLMRAHELQQCNNFKDPGVQHYGGDMFRSLRDIADDIFMNLPPPVPSAPTNNPYAPQGNNYNNRDQSNQGSGNMARGGGGFAAQPICMASYNNVSNGCFDGSCEVLMSDGGLKAVRDIKPGDMVQCVIDNSHSKYAEVECILRTNITKKELELVELPGKLLLTPWHPVRINGEWKFPADIATRKSTGCDAIYSFLLKKDCDKSRRGMSMIINGYECVTLAHGIENDPVSSHNFFGTEKIVDAMKKCPGWGNGIIELKEGSMMRDEITGLICGITNQY